MEDYHKIIEALSTHFTKASRVSILHPVRVAHQQELENRLILVRRGVLQFDEGKQTVRAGQILFVPSGIMFSLTYRGLHDEDPLELSQDALIKYSESYFDSSGDDIVTVVFDAKAFGSLNFFRSLNIPSLVFENATIADLLLRVTKEKEEEKIGWERIAHAYIEQIMVYLLRYFSENKLFVEEFATNLSYLHDPRLIKLVSYIRENLNGDLSNRRLAEVADVSEDYVGQYFKMLTGINPQDYIEYQRMEQAVTLLRTTKNTIRSISQEVGYQDTAYFCRRFKMMFGIPAGKMRKRESVLKDK